jgi:hypothetical protein
VGWRTDSEYINHLNSTAQAPAVKVEDAALQGKLGSQPSFVVSRRIISFSGIAQGKNLAVGFAAVADTHHFNRVIARPAVKEPLVAHAKPEQRWVKALQLLDVASIGLQKTVQGFEKP